jgi:hypothetical protein
MFISQFCPLQHIEIYEVKMCTLTLREEHRLRVFENRVLRRIFGG